MFIPPGSPLPSLIWYSADDGDIVDDRFSVLNANNAGDDARVQNTLRIPALTKKHFAKAFACEARNNNVSRPSRNQITVDMRRESIWQQKREKL